MALVLGMNLGNGRARNTDCGRYIHGVVDS